MDELYPEPTTFGDCDFTSYSYLILSVVLSIFGSFITVVALGGADDYIFSHLGHMWLVGPLFICSGLMMGIKTVLYLRRKSVIQMLLRQRALLRVNNKLYLFFIFLILVQYYIKTVVFII